MAKRRPTKSNSKRRPAGLKRKLLLGILLFGSVAGLLICVVYGTWASFFDIKAVERIPERSVIYDCDGKAYSRLEGNNRVVVSLDKVSPFFVNALLAREDTRFYKHYGVDPIGIARAMCRNAIHLHIREGGSTLTQQLALNTFLGEKHNHSLHRKILEAFLALRIERNYSKRAIIEQYVNRIYFGTGVYGVETASQAYFAKPAAQLNLSEAAMLVGIIRSPGRFSPATHLDRALVQRNVVLGRMAELGMIKKEAADAAIASTPTITKRRLVSVQANYAIEMIQQDLDTILGDDFTDEGGLRIYTTIDPVLQKTAQESLDAELSKIEQKPGYSHPRRADFSGKSGEDTPYLQGAVMVIDNRTGGIRAMVGGRDYQESVFNRTRSPRQIGSTFKPFVYAAAFDRGLSPDQSIEDGPLRPGEIAGGGRWDPSNSDGTNRGTMSAAEGLIQSRNTVSARVGNIAGISEVRRVAEAAGLGDIPKFPSIFLGSFETSLKDLTSAYSIFPNKGIRRQSYIIERIDDPDGHILYKATHLETHARSSRSCAQVSRILVDVLRHGTAASASSMGFNRLAAGKTGTTNDYRDAWFVGFTQTLTCGVWVGLDRPQTIMAKGYGATLALPVWVNVMNAKPEGRDSGTFLADPDLPSGSESNPVRALPGNLMRSIRKLFERRP